jgi:hypothetical protein
VEGTVILLDGRRSASGGALDQLFLPKQEIQSSHPADRLLGSSIASPLYVAPRRLDECAGAPRGFIRVVKPGPVITVLLLKVRILRRPSANSSTSSA